MLPTHVVAFRRSDAQPAARPMAGEAPAPGLSPAALALLGILHRCSRGALDAPHGFQDEYAELCIHGLARRNAHGETSITEDGEASLSDWLDHA